MFLTEKEGQMKQSIIDDLIVKYFSKSANSTELNKLSESLRDKESRKTFRAYAKINHLVGCIMYDFKTKQEKEKLLNSIELEQKSNRVFKRIFLGLSAAAVIIALFAIPFFLQKTTSTDTYPSTPIVVKNTIVPGTDKAILTLSSGEEIPLIEGQAYNSNTINSNGKQLSYKSTALAKEKIEYNYLTIPKGGQFFVQLSDGTKVWLNSDSKLKYPVRFTKDTPREIELIYGEAYFEVAKADGKELNKAFVVKTKLQDVQVRGTAFNISAHEDQNYISTTLVEGKVEVTNGITTKNLSPGDQSKVALKSNDFTLSQVDILSVIAWKNGFFSFENETLETMLNTLSRWYNIDLNYQNPSKKDLRFSGVLKRTDNIEELLSSIQKTGQVAFEINENKIMVK